MTLRLVVQVLPLRSKPNPELWLFRSRSLLHGTGTELSSQHVSDRRSRRRVEKADLPGLVRFIGHFSSALA
eukprot:13894836-Heterocapsa_arctica.AAC.1